MKTSEGTAEVFAALAKAQATMGAAKKDSANPFFKSHYADLAQVMETARKPLGDNGLALIQDATVSDAGKVLICTRLVHCSGQWVEFGPLAIQPGKADAQGTVAAITYGRRAAAQAALGMAAEDDDGNSTQQAPGRTQTGAAAVAAIEKTFGTKLPTQTDRIKQAVAKPAPTPPPAAVDEWPEPGSDMDETPQAVCIDFGKNKGKPISELETKSLQWYQDACRTTLADEKWVKQHPAKQRLLDAITAELATRGVS